MQYEKVMDKFSSWAPMMRNYIESEEFDKIFIALKKLSQAGKKVAPESKDLFRSFSTCPKDKLKVLMVGFCPYHTFKDKVSVADGLAFSCSKTNRTEQQQPSLVTFYNAMEDDLYKGFNINHPRHNDLLYLSKQGVMLFNTQLTVLEGMAGVHEELWRNFTTYFLEEVISKYFTGLPIIFYGVAAQKFMKCINPLQHYILAVDHPASISYKGASAVYDHKNLFTWISRILKKNNNIEINWTGIESDKEPWDEPDTSTVPHIRSIDREYNDAFKDLPFD